MSNTNPNSQETPENEQGVEQGSENLETVSQEELDAATADAIAEAQETQAPQEDVLSVEEQQAAEIADLKEKLLRAMAETENMRRRSQKDKEDALNYGVTKFARDMLTISDNLRRAIDAVSEEDRENETVKTLLTGVEMTESELLSTFSKHKIQLIEAEGKKFDPNLHQAMFEIENPDVEPGTVLQVVQPGYVIADRLLRPALVGVSKGGQKKEEAHVDQKV
ncbi:nucleotide exchange factor GrpE [Sneathiella glossodoripedis]|uniref:nucleotide exchange factor GrpE n=1 Tax=Sneathiella glossodoripedis TaxID=418853 RepID=UPI000A059749|nr:nucleotide exchange factor GrpE [Sneathiella glossodoripedis]